MSLTFPRRTGHVSSEVSIKTESDMRASFIECRERGNDGPNSPSGHRFVFCQLVFCQSDVEYSFPGEYREQPVTASGFWQRRGSLRCRDYFRLVHFYCAFNIHPEILGDTLWGLYDC